MSRTSQQAQQPKSSAETAADGLLTHLHTWAQRQHQQLKTLLKQEPALSALMFQGRSLAELARPEGLAMMKQAAEEQQFDPIAMNHGIRRLQLDNYNGEIIWDYPGNETTIIEKDDITEALEEQAPSLINEILTSVDHVDKFPDSDSLTNPGGRWSYRSFYDKLGGVNTHLQRQCPTTWKLINSLKPNLTFGFAFISVLAPNTTIAAHKGSTSLRQRYHLGIEIPTDGTSRIRIGGTWKTWHTGKAFGFNDAIDHEVEHWSKERRIVLILDRWADHVPASVIEAINKHPELLQLAVLTQQSEATAIND